MDLIGAFARRPAGARLRPPSRSNLFREDREGFVMRVLGDEYAFEGDFQDGLPEAGGAGGDLGQFGIQMP